MGKLSVPLEGDLHKRLRRRAFDEDRPMAEIVREALEGWLDGEVPEEDQRPRSSRVPLRPESRSTAVVEPPAPAPVQDGEMAACKHEKAKRTVHSWGTVCECGAKL